MIKYFVTGTQAYGPVTKNSDLDIVLRQRELTNLTDFLNDHKIKMYQTPAQEIYDNLTGTGGFYFALGPITVNIIGVENDKNASYQEGSFDWWFERTEWMRKHDPYKNRKERIDAFNGRHIMGGDE